MPLALVVALGLQTAVLKRERNVDEDDVRYRLYLNRQRTPLTFDIPNGVESEAETHRTRGGIIYGQISWAVSGAYTYFNSDSFIKDRGKYYKRAFTAPVVRGETLLLLHQAPGIWSEATHSHVYRKGRFYDIGPAEAASIWKDGSVRGYYYIDDQGRPWTGLPGEAGRMQYFEWRNGTLKKTGTRSRS